MSVRSNCQAPVVNMPVTKWLLTITHHTFTESLC